MTVLETKNATMQFGGLTSVSALNLKVEEGQIIPLIGPNGPGKTTAFNMLSGIYTPTTGNILFFGDRINGLRTVQIAEKGIARTFQNIRLCKKRRGLENVLIGMTLHVKNGLLSTMLRLPGAVRSEPERMEFAHNLLTECGLEEHAAEAASSLPYGLQRRLEIARALATDPKLLLLDEPAAGMNPVETDELAQLILEIREKYHLSVLLIEHHMPFVMQIAENIYVLEYGHLIAEGGPAEIQEIPAVIKAYLGEEDDEDA